MKELNSEEGEFVPSYFSWISIEKQKAKAEKLANITKNKENDKSKDDEKNKK